MPISANEQISDAYIFQALELERYKANLRAQTTESLQKLERELLLLLTEIDPTQGRKQVRLDNFLEKVPVVVESYYEEERKTHEEALLALLFFLKDRPAKIVSDILGFSLFNQKLSEKEVRDLVSGLLVEGAPIREWWQRQPVLVQQRTADTIRKALTNGADLPALIAAVRGTSGNMLRDGTMAAARRDADSVVSTSVQKGVVETLMAVYFANSDVITAIQQKSTLDARTTDICIAYAGAVWSFPDLKPVGHKLPFNNGTPRHWKCRSVIIPLLKSFSDLQDSRLTTEEGSRVKGIQALLERDLRKRGFSKQEIEKTKAQTEKILNEDSPEDLSYENWLKNRPRNVQIAILGRTKYELWKKGKISFKDLVDQSGNPLSIEELIKKYK